MSAVRSRLSVADSGLRMTYAELAVFTRRDEVLPKDQAVKRQTAGDCYSSVFTKTKSESINSRARNGLCLVGPLAREALQTLPEHHGLLPQLLVIHHNLMVKPCCWRPHVCPWHREAELVPDLKLHHYWLKFTVSEDPLYDTKQERESSATSLRSTTVTCLQDRLVQQHYSC